jgi:hypothetical protein
LEGNRGDRRLRGADGRSTGRELVQSMRVPPVASLRDGAELDRSTDSIESHTQRLERPRTLFPNSKTIFLVGNRADAHGRAKPEHGAPEPATQSRARKSREPRHPNPLLQGDRAHDRIASSPLAAGERNGVTGKRAQRPAYFLKAWRPAEAEGTPRREPALA